MKTKEHKFSTSLKLERRLTERFLREGYLDPKELEKTLKVLPDESNNIRYLDVFEEPIEETEASKKERLTFTS